MNTQTSIKQSFGFKLSDKIKRTIVDVICYLYVLLFLYAASTKLLDYENSELQMSKSPIITDFAHILVWLVPTIEIVLAILLLVPKTVKYGLIASLGLMCLYTAYIFFILNYSQVIPCSCGGFLEMLSWKQHFIFNIIFLIMVITAILFNTKTSMSKDHLSQ